MIGKLLINLGYWFDKHFPEKVSTDEVWRQFSAIELRLHEVTKLEANVTKLSADHLSLVNEVFTLNKKVEALTSENSALKAASAMRMRIGSSIPMPGR